MARHRSRHGKSRGAFDAVCTLGIVAGLAWWNWGRVEVLMMSPEERRAIELSVTYSDCDEVRALGRDPVYEGQPGYRTTMDGDGDGIACEPYF